MLTLCENLRLVVAYPENLCCRPTGQCRICGNLHQLFSANHTIEFFDFFCGTLVTPDNRVPKHFVVLIQHHKPMHLPGNSNSPDLCLVDPTLSDYCLNGLYHCIFPIQRILFCITVFRLIHRIFHRGTCHYCAILPEQYRFCSACSTIYTN